jgi:ubiquinone/menaquinone biosynthesis C-methylase UbiE
MLNNILPILIKNDKQNVHDFWNEASCGEELYLKGEKIKEKYDYQAKERYRLEPEIIDFANFVNYSNKTILEIGVGLGADHQNWALVTPYLYGCDLTERAIEHTKQRLDLHNLQSNLKVADAEQLPYNDAFFDLVYSWGVIHHSPNTPKAIEEIYRVLKQGGAAKIMIYHKYSIVGFMLWIRYAFMTLKWNTTLHEIYSKHLESPGTKAYSYDEAKLLFAQFKIISIKTPLHHGDLLASEAGQRHKGFILTLARLFFPRFLIRKFLPNNGLFMMIHVQKS